mmetsp:Transcript_2963/g.5010  ORF Transcript_2963/g.5010 Transcript_2963/m.5010 type:complete len:159 (+) Transcript_2963:789-1265(+)
MKESTQKSQEFEKLLLGLHMGFLLIFLFFKWTSSKEPVSFLKEVRVLPSPLSWEKRKLNPYNTLLILTTSNFIGMVFSRGTHQQFYAWYSFSFPFLVDACSETFGPLSQFALIFCLELAWSVGKPHNALQGHLLNITHLTILLGLLYQSKQRRYLKQD